MKVCIYGAGAIGGYLAVELALAGVDVSCIARGPHLKAMRENGLKLRIGGEEKVTRIACAEEPGEFGPQDFVVMALKAPGAVAVADRLGPLIGPKTAVVTAQNGIPWWYLYTRIKWAADVGEHKTSMLQDLERGRQMEIDALGTAVQEMGRLAGVATPTIDMVLGLVKLGAREAGCYDG